LRTEAILVLRNNSTNSGVAIRHAKPSDYGRVIGRVNVWWGGREMAPVLPKLFFLHFEGTTFVAEDEEGDLAGFVCGFLSQSNADEAYIHFVGVSPDHRAQGLGRTLYERFFDEVRAQGRSVVRCVTSPLNERSVAFHQALGFEVERVAKDYDGPGEDRVLLLKRLSL
jgi:ribosomal protein S18 acetylase RimI-like enzyme